jgi:hypothetical protein
MAVTLNPVNIVPTRSSNSDEWIFWHQSLKKRYGKATANLLWVKAWNKRGQSAESYFGGPNTVRLRNYLEEQGIQIEGGLIGYYSDFFDSMDSFFVSTFNLGKYVSLVLLALVVIPIFIFMMNMARKPETALQLASLHPALRGVKTLK